MPDTEPIPAAASEADELARLRARIDSLEQELIETHARANAAIAAAQGRAYWLDRWHLDLNAVMARRGASEFRTLVRALRVVFRLLRRAKRAILR